MTFKIDYYEGDVLEWEITDAGVTVTENTEYTPIIYLLPDGDTSIPELRDAIEKHPSVITHSVVTKRPGWRYEETDVVQAYLSEISSVTQVAHEVSNWADPGEYKLFNIDFSREFRYCLENEITPVPTVTPSVCELRLPAKQLSERSLDGFEVDGESLHGTKRDILEDLYAYLTTYDPDILVLSSAELVPMLYNLADEVGYGEFDLGRRPGYQQLARESTYESYGQVGHSPARYNVPGRAIIDMENTFFWKQTNLNGILDLVERSRKPIQETAWASIGNVLTAIQINEANRREVLVPWNSWRHEKFKSMATLHDADRGGFIFSPEVGLHENVYEVDFSSLYPNIIRTRNISPETIRCECHADDEDVPTLGYSICDKPGYLPEVLSPIIADREQYKQEIRETDDPEREAELRGRSGALKWILVSCFGYQGFSNAKFGRIECHEAINAFAREILLDSKEILEAHGWRVIHGIVDSIWVQPVSGEEQTPLSELCEILTDEIGIKLDLEAQYDWIAFAPRVDGENGALNRYFGKYADSDEYKKRGIEVRQRSTPPFIEDAQMSLIQTLDTHRSPEEVCDRLQRYLSQLRKGDVDPARLLIKKRISQSAEEYSQFTHNVAALNRADLFDFRIQPGEDVRYVVVDDKKDSEDRVNLEFEELSEYDVEYYSDLLIRATESILSPLGWDRHDIRGYLSSTRDASIAAYS